MSGTRSRSEIESALTDKQTLHKRKLSSSSKDRFDADFNIEARSPRRQQVIGGALTGVSGRYKKSLFNKIAEMHLTNWLAVIVVACILIAFFWPHDRENIREIAEQQIEAQSEPFYTESRIDEQASAEPLQTFSRQNDLDRANQFREEEQLKAQLDDLLGQAEQHVSNGEYTAPENSSALYAYREMLNLDSGNSDAQNGIANLENRFLASGQEALRNDNEARARSALTGLRRIDADSEEQARLTNAIEEWQVTTKITDLMSKADSAREADNLILPADGSSLYFYREVLELDENSQVAKDGIKEIFNYYVDEANTAILKGDLEAATGYIATASVVDDEHPSIEIISNMIANATPIAAQVQISRDQNITDGIENSDDESVPENSALPPLSPPPNRQISDNRTPEQQASEQEVFDQVYLNQGLEAYYRGDYTTAAALLQPLADKGVSRAQFRIGYMYYLGRGFDRNQAEADRVLRAALPAIQKFANEGRSWAQSDLGSLYEDGLVLPRDYADAVFWYRSAAQQNYAGAQTNLGIMYAQGRGVTQSRQTAIEWFQRAAQQGDIAAIRNLESLGVN